MKKGHMSQQWQVVWSTKVPDEDTMLEFKPQAGVNHKDKYLKVFDATKKSMYSDQTGQFPITTSWGHKYLMVACKLNCNYIDAEPIKSRKTKDIIDAYQKIHRRWKGTSIISPN